MNWENGQIKKLIKMKDLSLCVLFWNEEKNIKNVVDKLTEVFLKNKVDFEIVTVDNGSTDGTLSLLKKLKKNNEHIKIVSIKHNKGYGFGVIVGLQNCNGKFIGFSDGDNQISAQDVFRVYQKISADNSIDLCKAKRVSRKDKFIRMVISKVYNNLFRILFKVNVKDINACPKIMKLEVYKEVVLTSKDWFIDAEIIIKLNALDKKFFDVPIVFREREQGASKVRFITIIEFLKNILDYKINKSKWKKI